jgi:hypothetical protein
MPPFDNHPTIWHGGLINFFAAETDVFLDTGFALVVLTNSDTANPDTIATESWIRCAPLPNTPVIVRFNRVVGNSEVGTRTAMSFFWHNWSSAYVN